MARIHGSDWGGAEGLGEEPRELVKTLILLSAIGGAIGAALLLLTPPMLFRQAVPILLGVGTILFASRPWVNAAMGRSGGDGLAWSVMYPAIGYWCSLSLQTDSKSAV